MVAYSSLVKPYTPSPKKRLGQHFLRDTGVLDRIVRWIHPLPDDVFLEIGAGDGALSSRLAPAIAGFIAVEMDRDCIPALEAVLARYEYATIVPADILSLDLERPLSPRLPPESRLRIAGNLPYNIATSIIEKLMHCSLTVHDMSFMVQAEVAQRITAGPGSKQYGYLSVHCQHHCDVRMGFRVSPSCFVPRPKVSSAMISLHPKNIARDPGLESDFEALGKAAFGHRRKTLANSLGKHAVFGPITSLLLKNAGIDGSRRAEELSIEEFETLARVYREDYKTDTADY